MQGNGTDQLAAACRCPWLLIASLHHFADRSCQRGHLHHKDMGQPAVKRNNGFIAYFSLEPETEGDSAERSLRQDIKTVKSNDAVSTSATATVLAWWLYVKSPELLSIDCQRPSRCMSSFYVKTKDLVQENSLLD